MQLYGPHVEAALKQRREYRSIMDELRAERGSLRVVDIGTAQNGHARRCFEAMVGERGDRLDLYDPYTSIQPSENPNVRVIDEDELMGQQYDVINLAYTCNAMTEHEIDDLLAALSFRNPNAQLTVVEYVLKGRCRNALQALLSAEAEEQALLEEGEANFYSQRSRFKIGDLLNIVRTAGWQKSNVKRLFTGRAFIRAESEYKDSSVMKAIFGAV